MFWLALIVFLGSIGWAYNEPGWEPYLFLISSLGVLLSHESHIKRFLKSFLPNKKKRTLIITNTSGVSYNKYSTLDVIKSVILDEDIDLSIVSAEAKELKKHARKNEKDSDASFHLQERAKKLEEKLLSVKKGLYRLATLHKKRLISCTLNDLPIMFENFVKIVFPVSITTPVNASVFDIYVKANNGDELSFTVDFNKEETEELLKKLKVTTTQKLAIPYYFMVSDIPECTINHKIIPKQIFSSLTNHKIYAEDDSYWFIQNWYFGPH